MFDKTMADTKNPTKDSLIEDLEDIKDSLQEDDLDDDIPVLTDAVIAKPGVREEEQLAFDEELIFDEEEGHDVEPPAQDFLSTEHSDEELLRAAYRQTLDETIPVLEGQQSLFEDDNATGIRPAIQEELPVDSGLPSARGENPFLPKHIRERLNQGKTSFLEEIAQVSASLNKSSSHSNSTRLDTGYEGDDGETVSVTLDANKPEIKAPPKVTPASDAQLKLVDEIIAEYLPKIEKELRARLIKILDEKNRL